MNCYWCETSPGPGGMRLKPTTASAVCQACGAALCREHSRRRDDQAIICAQCPALSKIHS